MLFEKKLLAKTKNQQSLCLLSCRKKTVFFSDSVQLLGFQTQKQKHIFFYFCFFIFSESQMSSKKTKTQKQVDQEENIEQQPNADSAAPLRRARKGNKSAKNQELEDVNASDADEKMDDDQEQHVEEGTQTKLQQSKASKTKNTKAKNDFSNNNNNNNTHHDNEESSAVGDQEEVDAEKAKEELAQKIARSKNLRSRSSILREMEKKLCHDAVEKWVLTSTEASNANMEAFFSWKVEDEKEMFATIINLPPMQLFKIYWGDGFGEQVKGDTVINYTGRKWSILFGQGMDDEAKEREDARLAADIEAAKGDLSKVQPHMLDVQGEAIDMLEESIKHRMEKLWLAEKFRKEEKKLLKAQQAGALTEMVKQKKLTREDATKNANEAAKNIFMSTYHMPLVYSDKEKYANQRPSISATHSFWEPAPEKQKRPANKVIKDHSYNGVFENPELQARFNKIVTEEKTIYNPPVIYDSDGVRIPKKFMEDPLIKPGDLIGVTIFPSAYAQKNSHYGEHIKVTNDIYLVTCAPLVDKKGKKYSEIYGALATPYKNMDQLKAEAEEKIKKQQATLIAEVTSQLKTDMKSFLEEEKAKDKLAMKTMLAEAAAEREQQNKPSILAEFKAVSNTLSGSALPKDLQKRKSEPSSNEGQQAKKQKSAVETDHTEKTSVEDKGEEKQQQQQEQQQQNEVEDADQNGEEYDEEPLKTD